MSIGMSPFRAPYGYDASNFTNHIFGDSRSPKYNGWIEEIQDILKVLKDNLQASQNQQKQYEYKHRVERHFQVDDLVYLRFHPYKQTTIKGKGS